MALEPDTEQLVRPVRREAHRNLICKQVKALGVYPIKLAEERRGKRLPLLAQLRPPLQTGWQ